jgi:dynein assembly factor 2, axonemal
MTETFLKEKFDDLKLTDDEVKRFSEAMKKEEFRKLLVDYANEISDPKNRKLYEEEIEKLENERGVDVTFINPEAGFVLKTVQDGEKKCFLNICTNTNINKPSSEITTRLEEKTGVEKKGMTWSIPHSCSPGREDLDKSSKKCIVYDVVYHPDSYRMGETNKRFKQLLQDTAIDTIEKNFKVKIDRTNCKILNNIKFKGVPTATVIRKAKSDESTLKNNEPQDDLFNKVKTPYKYPPSPPTPSEVPVKTETKISDEFEEPKYKIIDRGHMDIQDCVNQLKQIVNSTRPKELIIEIDLPLCKSTANVKLDIFEKRLYLESNKPNYKLDLNLAYPVNEDDGNAKFDKSKRKLVVSLPVKQSIIEIESNTNNLIESVDEINALNGDHEEYPPQVKVQQVEQETPTLVKEKVENIKYSLPSQYKFEQNSNDLRLKFYIKNFVEKSFTISISSQFLTIKYETVSNGGYVTYYSVYLDFNHDFIDLNTNYKLEHDNVHNFDEYVLIRFKKLTNIHIDKVYLSLNSKCEEKLVRNNY